MPAMIDTSTFLSIWYWLLMAVFWSMATHFTHGVPYDAMARAARLGGEDAELCDRLTRRMLERIDRGVRRWGVPGAALGGFVLTLLAVLGLSSRSEVALGLLVMIGPATAMLVLSLAEALRLHRDQPRPDALLAALFTRRRLNQLIGLTGVALAAAALMTLHGESLFL